MKYIKWLIINVLRMVQCLAAIILLYFSLCAVFYHIDCNLSISSDFKPIIDADVTVSPKILSNSSVDYSDHELFVVPKDLINPEDAEIYEQCIELDTPYTRSSFIEYEKCAVKKYLVVLGQGALLVLIIGLIVAGLKYLFVKRQESCDKFLYFSIKASLVFAIISGAHYLLFDGQYEKGYVEASSIPIVEVNDDAEDDFFDEEDCDVTDDIDDIDDDDYDTQMSDDPDMDESTWYTIVPNDCSHCNGTGECSMCHGTGRYPFISTCPDCMGTKKCVYCEGGKTKRKYKDIAIGSSNWQYSKYDKLREAEKAMMREAFITSSGESANPKNKFTYSDISDGFKEMFTVIGKGYYGRNFKTVFSYSVYKCPDCNGAGCDNCYNGYVFTNSNTRYISGAISGCNKFINGKLESVVGNSSNRGNVGGNTGGESNSIPSAFPYRCTNCNGTGKVIMPAPYPYFDESEGAWYCSDCGKYISKAYYHHHEECRVCRGNGLVEKND